MKSNPNNLPEVNHVTPFAGVWIEITLMLKIAVDGSESLPSRECGLKSLCGRNENNELYVTPFAGVWIEICADDVLEAAQDGHSLRGSVD